MDVKLVQNQYSKLTIKTINLAHDDPQNEEVYMRRSQVFATLAIAIELEEMNSTGLGVSAGLSSLTYDFDRLRQAIEELRD